MRKRNVILAIFVHSCMKKLLIILLVSLAGSLGADEILFNSRMLISPTHKTQLIEVSVTATEYNACKGQCDKDPLLTAGLYKINPKKATQQRFIAMSRNLLKRWKGVFNYGDMVRISGAKDKDGIYKVVDTMNKRFVTELTSLKQQGQKNISIIM